MEKHNIRLTSAEISALWTTYIECSATSCFYKYFLEHLHDKEIIPLITEALSLNDKFIRDIENKFSTEKFPTPQAFSDKDIDLSAPALYTDLFALSFAHFPSNVGGYRFQQFLHFQRD